MSSTRWKSLSSTEYDQRHVGYAEGMTGEPTSIREDEKLHADKAVENQINIVHAIQDKLANAERLNAGTNKYDSQVAAIKNELELNREVLFDLQKTQASAWKALDAEHKREGYVSGNLAPGPTVTTSASVTSDWGGTLTFLVLCIGIIIFFGSMVVSNAANVVTRDMNQLTGVTRGIVNGNLPITRYGGTSDPVPRSTDTTDPWF